MMGDQFKQLQGNKLLDQNSTIKQLGFVASETGQSLETIANFG